MTSNITGGGFSYGQVHSIPGNIGAAIKMQGMLNTLERLSYFSIFRNTYLLSEYYNVTCNCIFQVNMSVSVQDANGKIMITALTMGTTIKILPQEPIFSHANRFVQRIRNVDHSNGT